MDSNFLRFISKLAGKKRVLLTELSSNCSKLKSLDEKETSILEYSVDELKKNLKSPSFSYKDREFKGLINEVLFLLSSLQVVRQNRGGLIKTITGSQLVKKPKVSFKMVITNLMHRKIGDKNKLSWEDIILLVTYNKSTLEIKKKEKKNAKDVLLTGFNNKDYWMKYQYFIYSVFAKTFYIKEDSVSSYFRHISSIIDNFGYTNFILRVF